ncbi:transport system permease protein, partial [Pseudomonas syringae pv. pisi str. 1704B]
RRLGSRNWHHVLLATPLLLLIPLSLLLAKPLNLIGLGDEAAQSLGTGLTRTRWLAMGSAVLLTSLGVGIIGPVSFVGLVAPHMARRLVGGHHQYLPPRLHGPRRVITGAGRYARPHADRAQRNSGRDSHGSDRRSVFPLAAGPIQRLIP